MVTAYVKEKVVKKNAGKEAKPDVQNRRKSLKDPEKVRSLFKKDSKADLKDSKETKDKEPPKNEYVPTITEPPKK